MGRSCTLMPLPHLATTTRRHETCTVHTHLNDDEPQLIADSSGIIWLQSIRIWKWQRNLPSSSSSIVTKCKQNSKPSRLRVVLHERKCKCDLCIWPFSIEIARVMTNSIEKNNRSCHTFIRVIGGTAASAVKCGTWCIGRRCRFHDHRQWRNWQLTLRLFLLSCLFHFFVLTLFLYILFLHYCQGIQQGRLLSWTFHY